MAWACGLPRTLAEEVGISSDTALRLGRFFGMDAKVWLNLQQRFELETLEREIGAEIEKIAPFAREAA